MSSAGDAKKGHYSSSCPNTQRVFTAQVMEEDGETEPQIPSDKPSDDAENHVEQDDPIEDQLDDPNGSQYDSTQEGFPLNEYEEYVEILDDHESNDTLLGCGWEYSHLVCTYVE